MNAKLPLNSNRVPPIEVERLAQRFKEAGLPDRNTRYLRSIDFRELKYRNHQIAFLTNHLKDGYEKDLIIEILEKSFEIFEGPIIRAMRAIFDTIMGQGIHPTLSEDHEELIISKILNEENQGNPMRPKEVAAYTNEQFHLLF